MAQKMAKRSALGNWGRAVKRLVPQPQKPLVAVVVVVLGLCTLSGIVLSQGQGLEIERPLNPQVDSINTQVDGEDAIKTQAQLEGEGSSGVQVPSEKSTNNIEEQEINHYRVHVDGAVASPGVYTLDTSDARVSDAVECAGGLIESADTSAINLAEVLVDGAKVHIPSMGEESKPQGSAQVIEGSSSTASSGSSGTSLSVSGNPENALINLNTATVEELQTLPGVGEATAKAIVEDRDAHGPYASPEDLMRVSGIGEKKFAKLQDKVCV